MAGSDWQKQFKFKKDPFEQVPPSPAKSFLVGLEEHQERIKTFLQSDQRVATLAGPKGTGKTAFLLSLSEEYKAPLLDAMQHNKKQLIVDALLAPTLTLIERMKSTMRLPPEEKEMLLHSKLQKSIILVDNAGQLGKQELELLSDLGTHTILADTQESLNELELPEPHIKLTLPKYRDDQLAELLKRRIDAAKGINPFDDVTAAELFSKSDRNPAALLELARDRAIELGTSPARPALLSVKTSPREAGAPHLTIKKVVPETATVSVEEVRPEMTIPEQHLEDAQMLGKIVERAEQANPAAQPAKRERPTTVDQVVKTLSKQPSAAPTKAPVKRAARPVPRQSKPAKPRAKPMKKPAPKKAKPAKKPAPKKSKR